MISFRVIPSLLLQGARLVKTMKFKEHRYVGDPRNAVKIFNEKEVDELLILDISATHEKRAPNFDLIHEIVSEAFMPIAYGGGVRTIDDMKKIFALGVEKIVLGACAAETPEIVKDASRVFGSQSIVVCIDSKMNASGEFEVFINSGERPLGTGPVEFARRMEKMGAGELIVNSIDRDGTMEGYDIKLLNTVTSAVTIPVIASGGASSIDDFKTAVMDGGVAGVAAGSLFVFYGKNRAVLITYPDRENLRRVFF